MPKTKKPGLYQRIIARDDKKRPHTLKEFWAKYGDSLGDCFVLNVKVLSKDSGTFQLSWTEKTVNEG